MKFFLNYTTVLPFTLFLVAQLVHGQEYINPAKNLSVTVSADTLLFKELVNNKLKFKIPVKKGSASHFLKFSASGDFLITSGKGSLTNLYLVYKDTAILTASLPVLTEEAVFSWPEEALYLLHSRSLFKTTLSSYNTKSWGKIADASLSFSAHDLTIEASGLLLGFCESANIHTLHTPNLTENKKYWQKTALRLLTFNPAIPDQAASVSIKNNIQIRDIKKDVVLIEINAHSAEIVWLGFDPTGKLLVSLDKQGYLFTWMPSLKQCIVQLEGVGGVPVFNLNGTLHLSSDGKGEEQGSVKLKKNTRRDSLSIQNYYLQTSAPPIEKFKLPIIDYAQPSPLISRLASR